MKGGAGTGAGMPAGRDPSGEPAYDALVIGAGPAGLTAALYLARYRRRTLVLHDRRSRALGAPMAWNVPGFPDGISGADLVARLTDQAERYGAEIELARVDCLSAGAGGAPFAARLEDGRRLSARGPSGAARCATARSATDLSIAGARSPYSGRTFMAPQRRCS